MHEAMLYERSSGGRVRCVLCAHRCRIEAGQYGLCGVRQNVDGRLYTRTYGRPVSRHLDPIEKKPLYHFLPGSLSYSVAAVGCNFRCEFCQNWQISQAKVSPAVEIEAAEVSCEELVAQALRMRAQSIAYTYTEPTIFMEYALGTARLARSAGLKNVFVTNGFMTEEALECMLPWIDAANVDLKFFTDEAYRRLCSGRLEPVCDTIRRMKENGMWVEVTTLLIPGENDDDGQLEGIARFLAGIDKDIPWHVSRFHPDFRFTKAAVTPRALIEKAVSAGRDAGLRFIYPGNAGQMEAATRCPWCSATVVQRQGFEVAENRAVGGACSLCGGKIPGVFGP